MITANLRSPLDIAPAPAAAASRCVFERMIARQAAAIVAVIERECENEMPHLFSGEFFSHDVSV